MFRTLIAVGLAAGLLKQLCKSLDKQHLKRQEKEFKESLKTWEAEGGNLRPPAGT